MTVEFDGVLGTIEAASDCHPESRANARAKDPMNVCTASASSGISGENALRPQVSIKSGRDPSRGLRPRLRMTFGKVAPLELKCHASTMMLKGISVNAAH